MNIITLIGRLTRDVELSYVPNTGTAKADFALAIPRDFKNKDGEKEVDFIPVEFMGKKAENIAKYIEKGSLVAVQGNLRIDRYTDKQGNKRTYTKVRKPRCKRNNYGNKPNYRRRSYSYVYS